MSSILHRTTFEYKPIAHTPDYDTADYVINPDLSPIGGAIPSLKLHKLTGDVLSSLSAGEKDALITLAQYQTAAQLEVDTQTARLVAAGFEYPASSGQFFSFSTEYSPTVIALDGVTAVDIPDGAATTAFNVARAARVALIFTQATVPKGGDVLKSDISKATDKAGVDLVEDTRV